MGHKFKNIPKNKMLFSEWKAFSLDQTRTKKSEFVHLMEYCDYLDLFKKMAVI